MKKQFYHVEFEDEENQGGIHAVRRGVYDLISTVISSIFGVALILVFFFRVATVEGSSMSPTLDDSDRIVITNFTSGYEFSDVIVIYRADDVPLIKRVIAVEGDTIDINFETGEVILNGEVLSEEYIAEPTYRSFEDGPEYPLTVPKGYVFVMGDNRNDSLDSRSGQVGLVDTRSIVGKMVAELGNKE